MTAADASRSRKDLQCTADALAISGSSARN